MVNRLLVHLNEDEWKEAVKKIRVRPVEMINGTTGSKFYTLDLTFGNLGMTIFSPLGFGEETSFTGKPEDRLGAK